MSFFGTQSSPFAQSATFTQPSPFAPSAFAPFNATSTFDSTLYGIRKVQELTLSVKSRFVFVERTTTHSTAAQARADGSSSWFIKISSSQPPLGGLFGAASANTTTISTTPASTTGTASSPTTPAGKTGQIEVEVSWHNGQIFSKDRTTSSTTDLDIRQYSSMTFIPKKDPRNYVTFPIAENALLDGKPIKASIELNKVSTDAYAYEFDIVLSTASSVARTPQALPSKNHDILPQFLKDPHSVDVCFLFPNDHKAADVGVWAHRVVLSQSKVFAKMIDDAIQKATAASDAADFQQAASDGRKATAAGGAQQEKVKQEHKEDEGNMRSFFAVHEDETGSVTSFTDIESQADDSAGELSFSEPVTPDLSKLGCELGAVEATIKTEDDSNDDLGSPTATKQARQADTTIKTKSTDTATSEKTTTSAAGSGPRTLSFVVDQVSAVTFLALLQYIYTGEINLNPDTQHFTFSSINYSGTRPNTDNSDSQHQQQDRETAQWVPFTGLTYTSRLTDHLKYESLMLAADLYGIDDLATFCQQKVEQSMGPFTVCRILFEVAPRYPAIKAAALEYMINYRTSIFTKDHDPFKNYRSHPNCYDLMLEVVQLLANSK
ncbi:hypothetical protein BGW39_007837 [Mortierella sp. 14UC]|nr:hypothetical protein BGW39_007837 [Mortierella sp. 14UC]